MNTLSCIFICNWYFRNFHMKLWQLFFPLLAGGSYVRKFIKHFVLKSRSCSRFNWRCLEISLSHFLFFAYKLSSPACSWWGSRILWIQRVRSIQDQLGLLRCLMSLFISEHFFLNPCISDANDYIIYTTSTSIQTAHIDPNDQSVIFDPVYLPLTLAVTYDLDDNRAYFATVLLVQWLNSAVALSRLFV